MPRSSVRIVGSLADPEGLGWDEMIRSGSQRALVVLEFHEIAARTLERDASDLQVSQMLHLPGVSEPPGKPFWHRDASFDGGHVAVVLGTPTTEFLLGTYPEEYLEQGADLTHLEGRLDLWQAAPGEVVWYDRRAIHRSPPGIHSLDRPRLFLLATRPVRPAHPI